MKLDSRSFLLGALAAVSVSCAGDYRGPATPGKAPVPASGSLEEKLAAVVGQAPDQVRPSAAPGITEARWGSQFAYVTHDGSYVIFGDMYNLDTREEITETSRRGERLQQLSELGADNTIEFAPAEVKHTITVFTDIDCGYCRMLHRQMGDYNARGIAVRYVFFPRSGPDTDSFRKAQAVWCSADRRSALTQAKNSGSISGPTDCSNPIQREFDLAMKLGIRGTPLIVLPDGETIPGYVPPEQLEARLLAMGKTSETAKN